MIVAPVVGPTYEGIAFPVSHDEWLTCKHVVPGDAPAYELAGVELLGRPRLSGAAEGLDGDWSLLHGVQCPTTPTPVDFASPLDPGAEAWVVGWRVVGEGADAGYRRWYVKASIGERRNASPAWYLDGMAQADNPGLSGAPVVMVEQGAARVIGIYCGVVKQGTSVAGIDLSERLRNVFLRPQEVTLLMRAQGNE